MAYSNSRKSVPSRKRNKAPYDGGTTFSVPSISCDTLTVNDEKVPADRVCYEVQNLTTQYATAAATPTLVRWDTQVTNIGGVVLQNDGSGNPTEVVLPSAGCYIISIGLTTTAPPWYIYFTIDSDPTGIHYGQIEGDLNRLTGTAAVLCNAGSVVRAYIVTSGPGLTPVAPGNPAEASTLTIVKAG